MVDTRQNFYIGNLNGVLSSAGNFTYAISNVVDKYPIRAEAVQRSNPSATLLDPKHWVGLSSTTAVQRAGLLAQLPVRYQQQTSMCVAEVMAEELQLLDIFYNTPLGGSGEYSVPYIYAKGHQIAANYTEGMQPQWALEAARMYGDCPQTMDPICSASENVSQAIASVTPAMDQEAAKHKITAYGPVQVNGTVGQSAAALAEAIDHFPIMVSVPVANGGMLFSPVPDGKGGYVAQWQPGSQVSGGHELLAWDHRLYVAYAGARPEFQIRCRNSWGAGYGQGGDVWLGASYLLWEAWSVTRAPVNPLCASLSSFLTQYGKNMPQDQIDALKQYMTEKGCA